MVDGLSHRVALLDRQDVGGHDAAGGLLAVLEELLDLLVEEFHQEEVPVRWPRPRSEAEEALLAAVEGQLMNLRKSRRGAGERPFLYERNENHYGFACAFAKLAEELLEGEGTLFPDAGGTIPPDSPGGGTEGARRIFRRD